MTPSPFLIQWAPALARFWSDPRRALDVAMGRGRHSTVLAAAGFRVFGVDADVHAVHEGVSRAHSSGHHVAAWCADLTMCPLPRERFELVVVTRYLQRDLFESLADAVVPGGAIVYETFTVHQRALGTGPTSPNHLLNPGELRASFAGFDVLFYEEATSPEAVARFVGRKPVH